MVFIRIEVPFCKINVYEVYQWMYLVYNRFSLTLVYCINLFEA